MYIYAVWHDKMILKVVKLLLYWRHSSVEGLACWKPAFIFLYSVDYRCTHCPKPPVVPCINLLTLFFLPLLPSELPFMLLCAIYSQLYRFFLSIEIIWGGVALLYTDKWSAVKPAVSEFTITLVSWLLKAVYACEGASQQLGETCSF